MTPEVADAIAEIRREYAQHTVLVGEDQHGGACVIVEDIPMGAPYAQAASWMGFHITHSCPYADTYPHFFRNDLQRLDNAALGEAMGAGHQFPAPGVVVDGKLPTRQAVQVSRRSNHRDASSGLETPLIKMVKVLQWIRSR
jgi:hypothetical protein